MTDDTTYTLENLRPITPAGPDVNIAIAFYENELGFKAVYRDDSGNAAIVKRGSIELWLQQTDDKHWASQTAYHVRTKNVKAFYDELASRKSKAIHPNGHLSQKPWGSTEFAILDPFGVCITFYEFPQD